MFYKSNNFDTNILEVEEKYSPWQLIMLLLCAVGIGAITGTLIIYLLSFVTKIDARNLIDVLQNTNFDNRNFVRLILFINHFLMFCLPVVILSWIIFRASWAKYLGLTQRPQAKWLVMGALLLLVSMPFIQYVYALNQQLSLPSFMKNAEDSMDNALKGLLVYDNSIELIFNILVIALVPALGEEMIFRGWIQRQLMRIINRPHAAIWASAAIFSAIHFQFLGFLPRLLLGVLLGYLYFWTGSLWVSIFAHFLNNGLQVIAQYFFRVEFEKMDENQAQIPMYMAFLSLGLCFIICKYFLDNVTSNNKIFNQKEPII